MDERTKLCPINGLSVIVVDQDKHHANSARTMLCQVNFQATAYTSPIEALHFLEGHAQEVDVAFVALHMEEIHGFQFLDIVREAHKDIQVISNEETQGASHQKHNNTNKTKKGYICWTPYLHGKFLRALEILREGACARNIEIIMNINRVNRKHIASHMQDQDMLDEQARSLYVSSAYTAMQRSIQLGIMYDESQHVDVLSSDEAAKYAILITEDEAALHHNT
ncbi:two-component response regulator ORR29-like [Miscanthus floridulus]|uniref:two-component response regulator ORR29-like n=1 Tax=Miscanthus floridulus TaxID=154761 RepID=UPI00345B3CC0